MMTLLLDILSITFFRFPLLHVATLLMSGRRCLEVVLVRDTSASLRLVDRQVNYLLV